MAMSVRTRIAVSRAVPGPFREARHRSWLEAWILRFAPPGPYCDRCSMPNLVLTYGGGGIENVSGFLAINEMLMQSHEGVIRFFPVWPKEQDARFGSLRAVGAFLVSAELTNGVVGAVKIRSEKGRACTVQNPWPGKNVQLVRNGKAAETATGARFTWGTAPGEILELQEAH